MKPVIDRRSFGNVDRYFAKEMPMPPPKRTKPNAMPTNGASRMADANVMSEEKLRQSMKPRLLDQKELPPEIQKALDTA